MKTLYYHGHIYTMDQEQPYANAILVENNHIIAIGSNEEMLALIDENTEKVSLFNHCMIPGLNDSHLHLYGFAKQQHSISLFQCQSLEEAKQRIHTFIKEKNPDSHRLLVARGWHESVMGLSNHLTKNELDSICSDYPLICIRVCGHSCTLNSKAITLCGIQKSESHHDGTIDIQTGIITEQAMDCLEPYFEKTNPDTIQTTLLEGIRIANRFGITSLQTDDLASVAGEDYQMMYQAYQTLNHNHMLDARITLQARISDTDILKRFIKQINLSEHHDSFLKVGPLKVMSDGSLGARTAALLEPYCDDIHQRGILYYDDATLFQLMKTAHHNDVPIVVHCIGDRAMMQVTDVFKLLQEEEPKPYLRHGIIHCQITNEELLNRFKELNLIAYIQPIFLDDDIGIVYHRLGEKRANEAYAFKSMLNKGIVITMGTDCPVTSINPFENIYTAVVRKTLKNDTQTSYRPEEKLSIEEAVYAYTHASAMASGDGMTKGKLIPGYVADFAVLDQNIFTIQLEQVRYTKALMTVMDGKVRYLAPSYIKD